VGLTYSWEGHDFYVLHIPGQGSWAYDLSTGLWDEVTSFGRDFFRGAVSATGVNSQPLFGDDATNTIWEMTVEQRFDGDDPVLFEWTGLLEVADAPVRCNNVVLSVGVGTSDDPAEDPAIQMSVSDDGGAVFGDQYEQPLGRQGSRGQR
jgi:hypothetical protein